MVLCLVRILLIVLIGSTPVSAQSRMVVPSGASLPATCAVGDSFVLNTNYIDFYACVGSNIWRAAGSSLLGQLTAADMNSTADQAIPIKANRYIVRRIVVSAASINLTTSAGGIYPTTAKGGTALVANTQVYTALTTAAKFVDLTLAAGAGTDVNTATTLYLSLTTPQGSAATANLYVFGDTLP